MSRRDKKITVDEIKTVASDKKAAMARLRERVLKGPGAGADPDLDSTIERFYSVLDDPNKKWPCVELRHEHVLVLEYLLELRFLRDYYDDGGGGYLMPAT